MVTRRVGRENPHMQYVVMIGSDGMLAYQLPPPHSGQKAPASAGETPDEGMELGVVAAASVHRCMSASMHARMLAHAHACV